MLRLTTTYRFRVPDGVAVLALTLIAVSAAAGSVTWQDPQDAAPAELRAAPSIQRAAEPPVESESVRPDERFKLRISLFRHG